MAIDHDGALGGPDPEATAGPEGTVPPERVAGGEMIGLRQGMFGVGGTGDTSGTDASSGPSRCPVARRARTEGGSTSSSTLWPTRSTTVGVLFDDAIEKVVVFRGELTLHVRREYLPTAARRLRDDRRCASSCVSE